LALISYVIVMMACSSPFEEGVSILVQSSDGCFWDWFEECPTCVVHCALCLLSTSCGKVRARHETCKSKVVLLCDTPVQVCMSEATQHGLTTPEKSAAMQAFRDKNEVRAKKSMLFLRWVPRQNWDPLPQGN